MKKLRMSISVGSLRSQYSFHWTIAPQVGEISGNQGLESFLCFPNVVFHCFSACGNSDWNLRFSNVNLSCDSFKKNAPLFPYVRWHILWSSGINLSLVEWELERGNRGQWLEPHTVRSPGSHVLLCHWVTSWPWTSDSVFVSYCLSAKGERAWAAETVLGALGQEGRGPCPRPNSPNPY